MKSRGRPKGPEKVVFRARVTPEVKERLGRLMAESHPATGPEVEPLTLALRKEVESLRAGNRALLEDVGRLTEEAGELRRKLEGAWAMTEDQKAAYWKGEYFKLKEAVRREFGEG